MRAVRVLLPFLLLTACGDDDEGDAYDAPLTAVFDARTFDAARSFDAPVGGGADASSVCVPTSPSTEVCDDVDNDCNGLVDDVDSGGDGIFDCQRILLIGIAGANPSANFVTWLTGNGSQVERVLTTTAGEITSALLSDVQVVILDRVTRTFTAGEAAILEAWIEDGGGLMVMTGYSGGATDIDRPNSLLAPLGLAYKPGLLNGPATTFATHPLTAGLSSVTFAGGFAVGPLDADAGPGEGTNVTVATVPSGAVVGIAQTRGAGRVFVWGDEWVTFDSEWSSMPMIQTFWVNTLGWLERLR